MQNKNLFQKMFQEIQNAHYILVVTHKNPDADTLSCALSLSNYFFENKIKHKVFNISSTLPRRLNFLTKFDKITDVIPKYYDLIIYVDCADEYRVGKEFSKEIFSICIDHHQSNSGFANINIVDDTKGSTAELLYSFYQENNLKISKKNAECLYVGIYDDSIALTSPRTNKNTFTVLSSLMESKIDVSYISKNLLKRDSLARFRLLPKIMNTLDLYCEGAFGIVHMEERWIQETGADSSECDDIVDMVLNLGIVKVVAYCRVIDTTMRVSLRSKGDIDVAKIAAKFKGGGHKNSAGLSLDTICVESTKKALLETTQEYI